MATIHRFDARTGVPALGAAATAFLAGIDNPNTVRAYATAVRALVAEIGERASLTELEGEAGADRLVAWFLTR
jgi:integrase/recombinase XerC/integrase/recombinase XerD